MQFRSLAHNTDIYATRCVYPPKWLNTRNLSQSTLNKIEYLNDNTNEKFFDFLMVLYIELNKSE